MQEIVAYGIDGSPFLRSVQMGLEEKRAPYRVKAMAPGAQKSPEHLARHPFARVPVIEHGDFRLYETQAILRYLDALLPDPPLQPTEARAIGRMNQIVGINDWYLFPKVAAVIVFNRLIGPLLLGTTADEAAIEAAMPPVDRRPDGRAATGFSSCNARGAGAAGRNRAVRLAGAHERTPKHAAHPTAWPAARPLTPIPIGSARRLGLREGR
jgi:hypothetical protein